MVYRLWFHNEDKESKGCVRAVVWCLEFNKFLYTIIFTERKTYMTNKTVLNDTVSALLCTVLMWRSHYDKFWSNGVCPLYSRGGGCNGRTWACPIWHRAKAEKSQFKEHLFQNNSRNKHSPYPLLILCILSFKRGKLSIQHYLGTDKWILWCGVHPTRQKKHVCSNSHSALT